MIKTLLLSSLLCIGCADSSKDTGGTPAPITPTEGQSWWIDLSTSEVVEPEGGDGILSLIEGDYSLLASALNVTENSFDLLFALASDDKRQDHCNRTVSLTGLALDTDGSIAFGPQDFTIANGILTEELVITARFSADLSALDEIDLKGAIRLSTIPEDMLPLGGVEPCALLESIDISCEPCKDGVVDCIGVHTTGLAGVLQTDLTLDPVSEADAHADCVLDDTGGR
jgi:hypothetical protein